VLFVIHCVAVALLLAIVAWLTPGCSFPEEGIPVDTCPDCYRPPHFAGAKLTGDPPMDDGSEEEGSSGDGATTESSDVGSSSEASLESTSNVDSSTDASDAEDSSSTGDAPCNDDCPEGEYCTAQGECIVPFDARHCDPLECAPWDRIVPDDWTTACYCARECVSDDACDDDEVCDPVLGRCVLPCNGAEDCPQGTDPTMACGVLYDGPVHFCAYTEDAP
jgi:hypothetical protein